MPWSSYKCQALPTSVKTNTAVSRGHDWRQGDRGSETGRQIYYKLQIITTNMNINTTGGKWMLEIWEAEIGLYSVTNKTISWCFVGWLVVFERPASSVLAVCCMMKCIRYNHKRSHQQIKERHPDFLWPRGNLSRWYRANHLTHLSFYWPVTRLNHQVWRSNLVFWLGGGNCLQMGPQSPVISRWCNSQGRNFHSIY